MAKQRMSGLPGLSLVDRLEDGTPAGVRAEQILAALSRGYWDLVCRDCKVKKRIDVQQGENIYRKAEEEDWEFVKSAQGEEAVCPRCARMNIDNVHRRKVEKQYKESLKRDLEWLLNTRRTFDSRMEDYPQSKSSVYAYGIKDVTSVNVGSTKSQSELIHMMRESVCSFERRLKNVTIDFRPVEGGTRLLQFTINAVLLIDPAPEEVRIEAILDPTNARYEVK